MTGRVIISIIAVLLLKVVDCNRYPRYQSPYIYQRPYGSQVIVVAPPSYGYGGYYPGYQGDNFYPHRLYNHGYHHGHHRMRRQTHALRRPFDMSPCYGVKCPDGQFCFPAAVLCFDMEYSHLFSNRACPQYRCLRILAYNPHFYREAEELAHFTQSSLVKVTKAPTPVSVTKEKL